jgi:PAS domain S-box-containing protein
MLDKELGKTFSDGEILYRQGDAADCLYIIVSGIVEIFREEGGMEASLARLGKGELFGEAGIFKNSRRAESARSAGESRVITAEYKVVLKKIRDDPSFAVHIIETMARRARERAVELERVVENLHLHQEELEAQNRELQESRETLEESRERFTELYDFAPVGYIELDETGIIRGINLTGATMLGTERAMLLGYPFALHVAPEDFGRFRNHIQACIDHAGKATVELTLKPKTTAPKTVQLLSVPSPARSRSIFRTAMMDITERRRVEEALKDSEERYRRIVETAIEGIWLGDRDGRTVFANPVLAGMLGYASAEMTGIRARNFLAPEDRTIWDSRSARHLAGEKLKVTVRLLKRNGDEIRVMAYMSPVFDREGKYAGGLAMVTEIEA